MKKPTRLKVLEMHQVGKTPREIARKLDLSTQRIYQILAGTSYLDADLERKRLARSA
jgi:hypothetical protein